MTEIAFIGFGELGSSLAECLAAADRHRRLRAYVHGWPEPSETCRRRLQASSTTGCGSPAEAVTGAEVLLAAVPATVSFELARASAGHLSSGALYADLAIGSSSRAGRGCAARCLGPTGFRVTMLDAPAGRAALARLQRSAYPKSRDAREMAARPIPTWSSPRSRGSQRAG